MKFFHLTDLHIGKTLHHYSLKEEQEAVLSEIISYAGSIHPDAVPWTIRQEDRQSGC